MSSENTPREYSNTPTEEQLQAYAKFQRTQQDMSGSPLLESIAELYFIGGYVAGGCYHWSLSIERHGEEIVATLHEPDNADYNTIVTEGQLPWFNALRHLVSTEG